MKKIIIFSLLLALVAASFNFVFAIPKAKADITTIINDPPTAVFNISANGITINSGGSTHSTAGRTINGNITIGSYSLDIDSSFNGFIGGSYTLNAYKPGAFPFTALTFPGTYASSISITDMTSGIWWDWAGSITFDAEGIITSSTSTTFPLSVVMTGPSEGASGQASVFNVVISNGTLPIAGNLIFLIAPADGMSGGFTGADYQSSFYITTDEERSLTTTFTPPHSGEYFVYYECADATGAVADSQNIAFSANLVKPNLNGQLVYTGTGNLYDFSVFPDTVVQTAEDITAGVPVPLTSCLPTTAYGIFSPDFKKKTSFTFQFDPVAPYPNPYVIIVSYISDTTGETLWTYTFSFVINAGGEGNPGSGTGVFSNGETPNAKPELTGISKLIHDAFIFTLNELFNPNFSDGSKLLARGIHFFASPIPDIVPQYTIPLPQMSLTITGRTPHLTFTSHDYSFAWIKDIEGFQLMHDAVQALLYMVLAFVAYGVLI